MDDRKKAFKTADKQIGKLLTVQYAEMTSDGVPRHGVGIVIRDYE
jgi:ATP-dependent DNA ligase